jgi:hypothetical protein
MLEDSIKKLQRLSQSTFDGSFNKQCIEETHKNLSGFVIYDVTIFAAARSSPEEAFMANVGQSLLVADVRNSRVFQFHIQGEFAIEQLDHNCCFITGIVPSSLRGIFKTNEVGQILRPVFHVRDTGKRLSDRDREGVTHFDAYHENLLVYSWRS